MMANIIETGYLVVVRPMAKLSHDILDMNFNHNPIGGVLELGKMWGVLALTAYHKNENLYINCWQFGSLSATLMVLRGEKQLYETIVMPQNKL